MNQEFLPSHGLKFEKKMFFKEGMELLFFFPYDHL